MPHPARGTLQIPHEAVHPRRILDGMSKPSRRAAARTEPPIERTQHWVAAISSVLLHLLLLALALWSKPVPMTPPQGASEPGGRMAVRFIGVEPPHVGPAAFSRPAATPPAASRVKSTPVPHADDPVPPDAPEQTAQVTPPAPAAPAPATPTPQWRRSHTWGRPPGMLQDNLSPVNAGRSRSAAVDRGRGNSAFADAPNMEVGGYRVYYDLLSESRLRAWRDQGMTELFLPLPGTRRYMVCPLETALKQESGPCRLLEPDSPELATIGDAREAINMQQVHRQGEILWRGPGPYR